MVKVRDGGRIRAVAARAHGTHDSKKTKTLDSASRKPSSQTCPTRIVSRTDWIFCSALTNTETQLLYCHRLGIPLPFIRPPRRHHCYHTCPHYPPSRPIPAAHYCTEFICHLYHHMACVAGGYRHRRHDALLLLIANLAQQLISADVDNSNRLCSSSSKGTKVEIVVRTLDRPPYAMAIDVTVSCPLVSSHVASAAASADALFIARAAEKKNISPKRKTSCRLRGARSRLPSHRVHHSARHRCPTASRCSRVHQQPLLRPLRRRASRGRFRRRPRR